MPQVGGSRGIASDSTCFLPDPRAKVEPCPGPSWPQSTCGWQPFAGSVPTSASIPIRAHPVRCSPGSQPGLSRGGKSRADNPNAVHHMQPRFPIPHTAGPHARPPRGPARLLCPATSPVPIGPSRAEYGLGAQPAALSCHCAPTPQAWPYPLLSVECLVVSDLAWISSSGKVSSGMTYLEYLVWKEVLTN
jgi:hypothetical protein